MGPSTTDVRLHIYHQIVATGVAPTADETADALACPLEDMRHAYRSLADGHVLVLQPKYLSIWMAMPFSNVPTPFTVVCRGRAYYANCAWDAFGVAAMLHADARILTQCPDCRESLDYGIRKGTPTRQAGVVHFAVPVRRWWDDVGYT